MTEPTPDPTPQQPDEQPRAGAARAEQADEQANADEQPRWPTRTPAAEPERPGRRTCRRARRAAEPDAPAEPDVPAQPEARRADTPSTPAAPTRRRSCPTEPRPDRPRGPGGADTPSTPAGPTCRRSPGRAGPEPRRRRGADARPRGARRPERRPAGVAEAPRPRHPRRGATPRRPATEQPGADGPLRRTRPTPGPRPVPAPRRAPAAAPRRRWRSRRRTRAPRPSPPAARPASPPPPGRDPAPGRRGGGVRRATTAPSTSARRRGRAPGRVLPGRHAAGGAGLLRPQVRRPGRAGRPGRAAARRGRTPVKERRPGAARGARPAARGARRRRPGRRWPSAWTGSTARGRAERRREAAARRGPRQEEARQREVLVVEAEEIAGHRRSRMQWKTAGERLQQLFEQWREAQRSGTRLDKPVEDALWKRFSHARTVFDRLGKHHFAQLHVEHGEAKAAKEKLIAEAEALSSSRDWGATRGVPHADGPLEGGRPRRPQGRRRPVGPLPRRPGRLLRGPLGRASSRTRSSAPTSRSRSSCSPRPRRCCRSRTSTPPRPRCATSRTAGTPPARCRGPTWPGSRGGCAPSSSRCATSRTRSGSGRTPRPAPAPPGLGHSSGASPGSSATCEAARRQQDRARAEKDARRPSRRGSTRAEASRTTRLSRTAVPTRDRHDLRPQAAGGPSSSTTPAGRAPAARRRGWDTWTVPVHRRPPGARSPARVVLLAGRDGAPGGVCAPVRRAHCSAWSTWSTCPHLAAWPVARARAVRALLRGDLVAGQRRLGLVPRRAGPLPARAGRRRGTPAPAPRGAASATCRPLPVGARGGDGVRRDALDGVAGRRRRARPRTAPGCCRRPRPPRAWGGGRAPAATTPRWPGGRTAPPGQPPAVTLVEHPGGCHGAGRVLRRPAPREPARAWLGRRRRPAARRW